jgi:TonB family protein
MKATLVILVTLVAVVTLTAPAAAQQQPSTAARYVSGAPPGLAPMAVGGGQVIVELSITPFGSIERARALRSTPPFTQMVLDALNSWRFTAATDDPIGRDGKPEGPRNVASKVIVAAVYRPPALQGPTLGERPQNVAAAAAEVAFPTSMPEPVYPATAPFGGVVIVEARVSAAGAVTETRVVSPAAPFDQAALDAARQWRFRGAAVNGADTYAYLIFGFPQPITGR